MSATPPAEILRQNRDWIGRTLRSDSVRGSNTVMAALEAVLAELQQAQAERDALRPLIDEVAELVEKNQQAIDALREIAKGAPKGNTHWEGLHARTIARDALVKLGEQP